MRHHIIFAFIILFSAFQQANAEKVNVHFDKSLLKQQEIEAPNKQTYVHFLYENLDMLDVVGGPTLPIKYINVKIPHNAKNISISVKKDGCSSIQLKNKIYPVQEPEPTSTNYFVHEFSSEDSTIYESKKGYPYESCRITDISCAGKSDKFVGIAICPLLYFPIEDRCEFTEDFLIEINYTSTMSYQPVAPSNYNPTHVPFYEYCIITNATLEEGFTRLLAWIREKGINAGVVRVEDILNDPAIVGDTVSCLYDDAGKIRQYLQYAYTYGGTRYVLFGGDDSILPIRYGTGCRQDGREDTWRFENDDEALHIPTDFYFSELDSNWNEDEDMYLGEDKDTMDYGSELSVGRLLCTNHSEIKNYVDKLLKYELYPGNGNFQYLHKAFYTQADHMQESSQAQYVARDIMDIFCDTVTISELPGAGYYTPTYPTGNEVIHRMKENFGYISWFNHGNPTSLTVKSGGLHSYDPKYAITTVTGDIPFVVRETANGIDSLKNNDYPAIAYSIACSITPFDIYKPEYTGFPNIGKSFTLGEGYGGPLLIGNTRVGWTLTTYKLQPFFNQQMRTHSVGQALNLAKLSNTHLKHHHALVVNVIGCPDINIWTGTPITFSASTSYNGTGSCTITANNQIDSAFVCTRNITDLTEVSSTIPYTPSAGSITISDSYNKIITLKGRNCLPQILPLYLQNTQILGSHHLIVKDVICGKNVRNGNPGDVEFATNSSTEVEQKGTFKMLPGTKVKLGAKLFVHQSEINY